MWLAKEGCMVIPMHPPCPSVYLDVFCLGYNLWGVILMSPPWLYAWVWHLYVSSALHSILGTPLGV